MPKQIFSNGASCLLGTAIVTTSAISTLTVQSGKGALFPSPSAGDWFVATLIKADYSAFECFKVTSRSGDVFTIDTRAFDGSTANTFSTSDLVVCSPNAGAFADLNASIATLQATQTTQGSSITTLQSDVGTINTTLAQKPRMDVGTKTLFYQAAAPTGWTQDTGVNDRVLRVVSGTGAGTGGSWTISGITVDGHALDVTQIPAHTHTETYVSVGGANNVLYEGGSVGGGSFTVNSGSTGGGQTHTHGLTIGSSWRPSYVDVIACSRAS